MPPRTPLIKDYGEFFSYAHSALSLASHKIPSELMKGLGLGGFQWGI